MNEMRGTKFGHRLGTIEEESLSELDEDSINSAHVGANNITTRSKVTKHRNATTNAAVISNYERRQNNSNSMRVAMRTLRRITQLAGGSLKQILRYCSPTPT